MTGDGPVPMDLGNVGTHEAKMTQSDLDTSNDMLYDDVCKRLERAQSRQGNRQERTERDWVCGIVEKELMNGRVAEEMTEGKKGGKKGSKGGKPDWYGDRDKGSTGNKGKIKGKGKSETRYCFDCGRASAYRNELSVQMDQQHWTKKRTKWHVVGK